RHVEPSLNVFVSYGRDNVDNSREECADLEPPYPDERQTKSRKKNESRHHVSARAKEVRYLKLLPVSGNLRPDHGCLGRDIVEGKSSLLICQRRHPEFVTSL